MAITLLVASSDEHFRELVRDNLLNVQNAKVVAEYPEVSGNLYIRVLQDLERYPEAALFLDLASDPDGGVKVLERVKQAAPDLYVVASNYTGDGDSVLTAVRAGANDYLVQPFKRLEFRDAVARLEHVPRRAASAGASKLGRIYTFLGVKGGVGATTLAVNFAAVLGQRKQRTVLLDLDWASNDCAMQVGAAPQYTLNEVGENLSRLDQALFEGLVTRDPLGFFLVGPPDALDHRAYFNEAMLREFTTFLVDKYEAVVVDAGRWLNDETTLSALHSSSVIFLVVDQEFPSIRNAQRYLAALVRLGFNQDQLRIVVNRYQKRNSAHVASLEKIQQTLNQKVFYGIPPAQHVLDSINRARPFVADRQAAPELDRAFRSFVDKATGGKREAPEAAKVNA